MKTKELPIDIIKALQHFRLENGSVPSPYFIPTKILISEDEILKTKTILFIYFNREAEESLSIHELNISQGKLSKKIQRIESNLDMKKIYETINSSNIQMKNIISYIFKEYILEASV